MPADKLKLSLIRNRYSEGALGTGAKVVAQHPGCHGEMDENEVTLSNVCGRIYIDEHDEQVRVAGIKVDYYAQRGALGFKVGTKLYERAAQIACESTGKPLASDWRRSSDAEAFWKKQVRKGRARYDADLERYVLSCPAPPLGRARRSRR